MTTAQFTKALAKAMAEDAMRKALQRTLRPRRRK